MLRERRKLTFTFQLIALSAVLIGFFFLLFPFGGVHAAEFRVTNTTELQNALTTAQSNGQDDVIYLAAGVYSAVENGKGFVYDSTNGDNRKLTICGENGTTAEQVILDGGNAFAPVLSLVDENPDHLNSAFTVQGITIRNGKMQERDQNGGGLCVSSKGDVTVKSCIITANTGDDGGGVAIYSSYGSVTFINNVVTDNIAMDDGGGVDIDIANVDTEKFVILKGNTIKNNKAEEDGGGLRIESRNLICVNNLIVKNRGYYGGGISLIPWSEGQSIFTNNTVTSNYAQEGGGIAIYSEEEYQVIVYFYNNIIWGNTASTGSDIYKVGDGMSYLYNNDYHDVVGGFIQVIDNIDTDPLFVDQINGDYHLQSSSPCIDKGTADAPELPDTDFEGDPRVVGAAPDIGADEVIAIPVPHIKVNNSDGPITLYQNDTLTITVSLNNNGITDNADWWLAADTPFGLYFFTFDGWTDAWVPGYQGPLFYLDSFEVLNMPVSGLPAGTYTLYFGVDTVMDGDVTWDSVYYDTVEVNII